MTSPMLSMSGLLIKPMIRMPIKSGDTPIDFSLIQFSFNEVTKIYLQTANNVKVSLQNNFEVFMKTFILYS